VNKPAFLKSNPLCEALPFLNTLQNKFHIVDRAGHVIMLLQASAVVKQVTLSHMSHNKTP